MVDQRPPIQSVDIFFDNFYARHPECSEWKSVFRQIVNDQLKIVKQRQLNRGYSGEISNPSGDVVPFEVEGPLSLVNVTMRDHPNLREIAGVFFVQPKGLNTKLRPTTHLNSCGEDWDYSWCCFLWWIPGSILVYHDHSGWEYFYLSVHKGFRAFLWSRKSEGPTDIMSEIEIEAKLVSVLKKMIVAGVLDS